MSFLRVPGHEQVTRHVVPSGSRTSGKAYACRCFGFWNTGKSLSVSFRRVPDLVKATLRVVWSRSRSRQSHESCSCIEIRIPAKPLGMRLQRDPNLGQATWRAVAAGSKSRPSRTVCGWLEIQIWATVADSASPHVSPKRWQPRRARCAQLDSLQCDRLCCRGGAESRIRA